MCVWVPSCPGFKSSSFFFHPTGRVHACPLSHVPLLGLTSEPGVGLFPAPQVAKLQQLLKEAQQANDKVQKDYNLLSEKSQKLHHDLEEQIHTNTQLLAENSQRQVELKVRTASSRSGPKAKLLMPPVPQPPSRPPPPLSTSSRSARVGPLFPHAHLPTCFPACIHVPAYATWLGLGPHRHLQPFHPTFQSQPSSNDHPPSPPPPPPRPQRQETNCNTHTHTHTHTADSLSPPFASVSPCCARCVPTGSLLSSRHLPPYLAIAPSYLEFSRWYPLRHCRA